MNNPLISVIVPIYNAEKYIEETIKSIINQTYQNLEILLINHNSTDGSRLIMDNYRLEDKRIKIIDLDINKGGPAYPRNVGITNARGEYIAFLDADDIWLLTKLEKQIKFLYNNKIKFTSSNSDLIDEKNNQYNISKKSKLFNKLISKKTLCDLIKNNFIITSSVLLHRELVREFDESKSTIAVEDYDMWLKIFSKREKEYKYQNEQLLKYRVVDESASGRSNILRQELKANKVLAAFLIEHEKFIWCYFTRLFFHLFRKKLKQIVMNMIG